jgi:hypothetical protein
MPGKLTVQLPLTLPPVESCSSKMTPLLFQAQVGGVEKVTVLPLSVKVSWWLPVQV